METAIGYPLRSRKQIYCTPLSSLLCFFPSLFSPPESFFASLCIFLFCLLVFLSFSPRSSRCHVIPQFRWLPPPSSCRRLQQWQTAATAAAATRAREHIDARTCTHARTRARHVSVSRQVGIQMDTDVTPVARLSTLYPFSPPVAPLSPSPSPRSGTHST